jgi:hypothetical protein
MGDVWLWARPRHRVATLVVVGAAGAAWANGALLVATFVRPRRNAEVPRGAGQEIHRYFPARGGGALNSSAVSLVLLC